MTKKQHRKKPKTETKKQKPTKTDQFRIYPTSKQITILERWLWLCCETYNAALDERKRAYRTAGISLSYAHECAELRECKEARPDLGAVPAKVRQEAVNR